MNTLRNFNKRKNGIKEHINPSPVEFLKWTCPPFILGTIHYQFLGYQVENLKNSKTTVKSIVRQQGFAG